MVLQPILHKVLFRGLQHRHSEEQVRAFNKQLNSKIQQQNRPSGFGHIDVGQVNFRKVYCLKLWPRQIQNNDWQNEVNYHCYHFGHH